MQVTLPVAIVHQCRQEFLLHLLLEVIRYNLHQMCLFDLCGRYTHHLGARLIEEDHLSVEGGHVDEFAGVPDHRCQFLQFLLRPPSFSDVS